MEEKNIAALSPRSTIPIFHHSNSPRVATLEKPVDQRQTGKLLAGELTFRVLRSLARFVPPVLLSLHRAGVAGDKSSFLEGRAKIGIGFH
jgi:hypothetical protein